jgi:hypothetical protein
VPLGIECAPLAVDAPDDYIENYGKWLKTEIAKAQQAQPYEERTAGEVVEATI